MIPGRPGKLSQRLLTCKNPLLSKEETDLSRNIAQGLSFVTWTLSRVKCSLTIIYYNCIIINKVHRQIMTKKVNLWKSHPVNEMLYFENNFSVLGHLFHFHSPAKPIILSIKPYLQRLQGFHSSLTERRRNERKINHSSMASQGGLKSKWSVVMREKSPTLQWLLREVWNQNDQSGQEI